MFADEPTGNLDSTSGAEVLGFLRRVVDTHGQTVVMVTHDPGAASWTDRAWAFRRALDAAEWARFIAGLKHLCTAAATEEMRVVYHHHMGTVIQTEFELDRLLADVPSLFMLLDPGHLAFAGIDPVAVTQRHAARIAHVHLKSVRPAIAERVRREGWSFCRAVTEGVFTIPGDGCVDFSAIFRILASVDYRGWLVVEAEEDPGKVPALPKAKLARHYVRTHAGV